MHNTTSIWTTLLSRKHGPLNLIYCAVNSMFYGQVKNYRTKKAAKKDEGNENKQDVTRKLKSKVYKHVEKINPEFIKICPLKYLSKLSKINNIYLFNKDTAKQFVTLIIDDLLKNTSFVMEANPGLGILTEELLKANVPFIRLYEDDLNFHSSLHNLQKKFPDRLDLKTQSLKKIYKYMFLENISNNKVYSEIFKGIKEKKWEEETCLQMIGTINEQEFIQTMIVNIIHQNSFMSYGRPSFYLTVPPSLWKKFTSSNDDGKLYNYKTILFQLFFEYKLLGQLDRLSFVPWQRQNNKIKKRSYKAQDNELIYAIKIEPKANLFTDIIKKEDLLYFWYFMQYNFITRKKRIIPELEKWFPDCGIKLIAKNFNIFTQFGDLCPMELLQLFKEVRSWPEFENSIFKISVLTNDASQDLEI